jgi:hypothetical protein
LDGGLGRGRVIIFILRNLGCRLLDGYIYSLLIFSR